MSELRGKPMFITLVAVVVTIVTVAFSAAGATSAPTKKQECTWGVSSTTAWVDGDGTIHQNKPVTTGCIP
jgi:hypothetical protein